MHENTPLGAASARVTAEGRMRVALRRAVRNLRETGVHETLANAIERTHEDARGMLATIVGHGQLELSDFDDWASTHDLDELPGTQAVRAARLELGRAQLLLDALHAFARHQNTRAFWLMEVADHSG